MRLKKLLSPAIAAMRHPGIRGSLTVILDASKIICKFASYTNTIQPDLKTLAEIAEILNVNIRELLVNTK